MTKLNLDLLLEKAKESSISSAELTEIIKRIEHPANDNELYTLLHILGRNGNSSYRKLVERFLYYPSNPMITRIALKTLCSYFELTKYYLKELKMFMRGVEWDDAEQISSMAISIAGFYIRETGDKSILRILLEIFDKNPTDEDVYAAISEAIGHGYSIDVTNQKIIKEAHEMLNAQETV